jgi:hypothetical protein
MLVSLSIFPGGLAKKYIFSVWDNFIHDSLLEISKIGCGF